MTAVAIAAVSGVPTRDFNPTIGRGNKHDMDYIYTDLDTTVRPGQTINVNPVVKNTGTQPSLAFMKVVVPMYGSNNSPAYTYEVNDGWTLIADRGAEKIYGYEDVLEYGNQTTPITDAMTMVNMSMDDFMNMGSYAFSMRAYLGDTNVVGSDLEAAWGTVGE